MHSLHLFYSAVLCSDPIDIDNGMVTFTGTSVGDSAAYSCDSGFSLVGGANTTCTQLGANFAAFSPAPPLCRREYCMNVTRVTTCFLILCESEHAF